MFGKTFLQQGSLPLLERHLIGAGRDTVPERLDIVDLILNRKRIEPRGRQRYRVRHVLDYTTGISNPLTVAFKSDVALFSCRRPNAWLPPRRRAIAPAAVGCKPMVTNPPAEPGALPSLAPQRGLIATEKSQGPFRCAFLVCTARSLEAVASETRGRGKHHEEPTAENVKLLLPPRQSRGTSLRVRPGTWD